jgi:DNA-binding response OmpR family regulator
MSHILIVEDESHLAQGLLFNLEAEGHEASVAESGEAGLEAVRESAFDLVVLDVMLPGISGFEVATELRKQGNYVPILMLTARSRAEDVLEGLEAGADDYLPKPFELSILLARIRSLLRRSSWSRRIEPAQQEDSGGVAPIETAVVDDHTIDFTNLEIRSNGEIVRLTLMEADLLRYFFRNSHRVISRKQILDEVWGLREDTDTRAIDNFIVRLRRYLEDDPAHPKRLLTVRGVGYRFEPEK